MEQLVDDAKAKGPQQLRQPPSQVVGTKCRYKCKVCKGKGHGKRTCKIIKPTPSVGPVNKNIWDGEKNNESEDNDVPLNEGIVHRTS
ncbi:hypothetical protein WN943_010623 [Citrus x changshan-huyou]